MSSGSKLIKGIQNPKRAYDFVHRELTKKWFFYRYNHTEGYRKYVEYIKDKEGPERAVGSDDNPNLGENQLNFLIDNGLQPHDKLIDIGCGILVGGEYFMTYLNCGNYTGIDISNELIEEGVRRIDDDVIENKKPTLKQNTDLKFNDINRTHNYAVANSVFTHLPKDHIDECLSNVGKVLEGKLFVTFFNKPKPGDQNFSYSEAELTELANKHGHSCRLVPQSEHYSDSQQMMEITVRVD